MIRFQPWTCLKRLWSDRRGSVAPIMALMVLPMTMVAGFSIDLARAHEGRLKLQQAVDAAALALAHQPVGTPVATLTTQAQTWINADLHDTDLALPATVNVGLTNGQLALSATTNEPAILSGLVGINQFDLHADATTKWGLNHVEVALVLDNTGSMSQNNKLANLKTAAQNLVTTLMAEAGNDPNAVKISIVPFSMTVNVGPQYQNAPWMSGVMPTAYGADVFTTTGTNRFTMFSNMHKTWGGCVESRPAPYDVQDTPPSTGGTLFVPFFAPDEPDTPKMGATNGFFNNYMGDGLSGTPTWQQRQGNAAKYALGTVLSGRNGTTGYQYGPNAGCELAPLLRLTNSQSALNTTLSQMVAIGDTNLAMGLQWGWLTLSPQAPFADGVAYNTPNTSKIIVFLTDGWNSTAAASDSDSSFYSGIGYIWQGRIGVTASASQNARNAALDSRTALICSNIKADGIIVYTVRIDVSSGTSPAVLQGCATSADKFYDVPNVANLDAAFQQIAGQIGKLRIAQ